MFTFSLTKNHVFAGTQRKSSTGDGLIGLLPTIHDSFEQVREIPRPPADLEKILTEISSKSLNEDKLQSGSAPPIQVVFRFSDIIIFVENLGTCVIRMEKKSITNNAS
ncbi:hypothetical protein V6N11_073759 [Hibiscus sabdariffa]